MRVLVAGLVPIDSGKTVFASSLAAALIKEGLAVSTSKPVGATDLWGGAEVLTRSKELRLVATRDGLMLQEAIGGRLPVEVVNPVAVLLAPTPPSRYSSWSAYESSLSRPSMRAVLARVTSCTGGSASMHLYNAQLQSRTTRRVLWELEDLMAVLSPQPVAASDEVFEGVFSGSAAQVADSCIAMEEASSDVVIIESNGDVAAPTPLSATPSLAVLVAPGEAYVVEGRRYSTALEAIAMDGRPWLTDTRELLRLTGHMAALELPLLEDPSESYEPDVLGQLLDTIKALSSRR